jgi:ribosomal protein L11 methyltransferase
VNTIQIKIKVSIIEQEILISELENLSVGFEQTDEELIAYFDEMKFESYEVNKILKPYTFQMETLMERNWNEVWEQNFNPIKIEDFCGIRAEFHQPIMAVEHELLITPKMSFGTGHHATTYMMIEQMRNMDFNNRSVLDFGTGTGVLAILAEKCGATKILAIDNDEWSIANAKENIKKNNCEAIIVELSSKLPDKKFDIILANINKNVLVENMSQLKECLCENGCLLMSGLLTTDEEDIIKASRSVELQLKNKTVKDNWISLLYMNCK